MDRMSRLTAAAMIIALLFLQGAAAARWCACLEAIGKPACCQTKMPCCEGGECTAHPEAKFDKHLALDLLKALEAVSALPKLDLAPLHPEPIQTQRNPEPDDVRVRGPDRLGNSLRAPPHKA